MDQIKASEWQKAGHVISTLVMFVKYRNILLTFVNLNIAAKVVKWLVSQARCVSFDSSLDNVIPSSDQSLKWTTLNTILKMTIYIHLTTVIYSDIVERILTMFN